MLDRVRHFNGEGPAYRVDLELHGGSVRPRVGKVDTADPQVFIAAEIDDYGEYHAVPLLGEVPLLGYLFRFDGDQSVWTELLIQETPQVLHCGDG